MRPEKIEALPAQCAAELGLPAAIVIGVMETGDIIINAHGLNHVATVQALAVGIHAILSDHDKAVLAGAAGPEAQARFESYEGVRCIETEADADA